MALVTPSPPSPKESTDPAVQAVAESLADKDNRIQVAAVLVNRHPALPTPSGRATDRPHLVAKVSMDSRDRALRILDALVKGLESHGYPVSSRGALVEGQLVPIMISETDNRIPHVSTPKELASQVRNPWERIPTWDYVPSGRLVIELDVYVWWRRDLRKRWGDNKTLKLEDVLDEALVGIVALGVALRRRADEDQAKQEQAAERERLRRERELQAAKDLACHNDIIAGARAFADAQKVRRLINAVEDRLSSDEHPPSAAMQAWLDSAARVATKLDPLGAGLAELTERHKAVIAAAGGTE